MATSQPDNPRTDTSPETPAKQDVTLQTAIQYVKGVGPRRAERFHHLGIRTVHDLLQHLPHRYELERAQQPIGELVADQNTSAIGEITATRLVGRGRKARFEATLSDGTGRLHLTWFNGGYLAKKLHAGSLIRVQAKTKRYQGYMQMVNPKWEPIQESELEAAKATQGDKDSKSRCATDDRIRPIYPATEDLPSEVIDQAVQNILEEATTLVEDFLPEAYRNKRELPALGDAYFKIHRPTHESEVASARRRLVLDEFLLLQLAIAMKRAQMREQSHASPLPWSDTIDDHIRARFPFALTSAQDEAITDIRQDLQKTYPMNRMLQGDVGSGKTVVALYAMLMAIVAKQQAALMAPTEILAEQHFLSITEMLKESDVRIELLTGRMPKADQDSIKQRLARGEIDMIIGTHALLSKGVQFQSLALVVIDEQHRFGVEQRATLRERAAEVACLDNASQEGEGALFASATGEDSTSPPTRPDGFAPHTLVMTATPIPRTMSLTVFGDLDVSTISELPPGRSPVITRVVQDEQRDTVYDYLAERIANGEQAYIVVPAIEESPAAELKYVTEHSRELAESYFKGFEVAEMHGRMKRETRSRLMHRFRQNEIQVLVATTVIEVGVDVPNASIMVVEHAERFGLSQLHQLRGRVGRGSRKSICVFFANPTTDDATKRMEAIGATTDGFEIAERDFEIRGMGEIFGTRQSGASPFEVAEFPRDFAMLRMARRDAEKWIAQDPQLEKPKHTLLRKQLLLKVGQHFGIGDVA